MRTRRLLWPYFILCFFAGLGLYLGWRQFWFLTDDAFITFRYALNAVAGHGFTWNPEPFHPVEGYTSFLWLLILTIIWKLTGLNPPEVANALSLLFGAATLIVGAKIVMRMSVPAPVERKGRRFILLALVLLGVLTNRTFLTWLSSGLETSLFNFCLTWWIYLAIFPPDINTRRGEFALTVSAALTYLARPDGILVVIATIVLLVDRFKDSVSLGTIRRWLSAAPLLVVPIHLIWRRATYGEWLPNTFYAKQVSPWPEAGLRYLASFILEYGVWIWLALAVAYLTPLILNRRRGDGLVAKPGFNEGIVGAVLAFHLGYYTFIVGGDHFEYRVYSYTLLLLFVSAAWLSVRVVKRFWIAALLLAAFVVFSWPIPWVHWAQTKDRVKIEETFNMKVPIAHLFPAPFNVVVKKWDELQHELIFHWVCCRHQEHKNYLASKEAPRKYRTVSAISWDRTVLCEGSVGLLGWNNPEKAIVDLKGLNDWFVAQDSPDKEMTRMMAHEKSAPYAYGVCFCGKEEKAFTDQEVAACEKAAMDELGIQSGPKAWR
jgi:arabinofuranosyltransferase